MAGEDDRRVRELGEAHQALVHRAGIRSRKVGAPASLEEERVARDESPRDEETLAARGVPRRVDAGHLHLADRDGIAGGTGPEMVGPDTGRALHPGDLVLVDMDGDVVCGQEGGDSLDVVAEE